MVRQYYVAEGDDGAFPRVLVISPMGRKGATVYCPPLEDEKAWTQQFDDLDDAVDVAASLISRTGQRLPLLTRDEIAWWLIGLSAET